MLTKLLLDPIFSLLAGLVGRIPEQSLTLPDVSSALDIIGYGAYFFPMDAFATIISMVIFWYTALMMWAIIEWIYKKIPGVS